MRPEVQAAIRLFVQTVALAPESALLLDYDGTLAPFHVKRDQAFPYPGVALLLQEIVRDSRTRVVVVTGRDVNDLMPLLNIHPRPEDLGKPRTSATSSQWHSRDAETGFGNPQRVVGC